MEKIIYNTKLKKIVVITLMFLLLSNVFCPIISLATEDESLAERGRRIIVERALGLKVQEILGSVENQENWVPEDLLINVADPDGLSGLGSILRSLGCDMNDPYLAPACTAAVEAYNTEIQRNYQYNQDNPDNKKNAETAAREALAGGVSAGLGTLTEIEENEADIGGILLSPIFYLINFIADAIMINLEAIMTGEELTLVESTGVGLLASTPNNESIQGLTPEEINDDNRFSVKNIDMSSNFLGDIQYPKFTYTPEYIFSGDCEILSIDFISNSDGVSDSGWTSVRNVVKGWYKALRLMAVVGMLSVLIYTGIKIIISANAKDKAKYKEWIINWFMGFAILFAMHIIMAFIISVIGQFRNAIAGSSREIVISCNGEQSVTNLMGLVRFMIQSEDFYTKVAYEVMYIALIVYTIKFTIIYLKRVMNMAFLTLVAPIVALMYPIDKINDGRAQAFDMWLKEYIFNALLQPMHLMLYYILVGSAIDLATNNPIYGIVVLAFMTEAERLLKKIFGFDKASGGTVGGMTSAFAAGALASNIKNIARLGGSKGKGNSSKEQVDHSYLDNVKSLSNESGTEGFTHSMIGASSSDSSEEETKDKKDTPSAPSNSEEPEEEQIPETPAPVISPESNTPEADNGQETTKTPTRVKVRKATQGTGSGTSTVSNNTAIDGNKKAEIDAIQTASERRHAAADKRREAAANLQKEVSDPPKVSQTPVKDMAKKKDEDKKKEEDIHNKLSDEEKAKIQTSQNGKKKLTPAQSGFSNVGKTLLKPVYDIDREKHNKGYNRRRYKRRIVNAGKGLGRFAVGAALGTAAAAVQMGISITDGKYNPLEGAATFAAGYAGGGQITKAIGKSTNKLTDAYKQGYYEDRSNKELQAELREQKRIEFMDSDEVFKAYKKKYGTSEKAMEMMELAADNLLPFGYEDPKEQFKMIKMADKIEKLNQDKFDGLDDEGKANFRKQAVIQARNTKGFIEQLSSQGQLSAIRDPDKRESYINSEIEDRGLDKNSVEAQNIRKSLNNAFTSAGVWYDVNK